MKEPSIRSPEQVEAGATLSGKLGSELQLPAQSPTIKTNARGEGEDEKEAWVSGKSESRAPEVSADPLERELDTSNNNI